MAKLASILSGVLHVCIMLLGIAAGIFMILGAYGTYNVKWSDAVSDGTVKYLVPSTAYQYGNVTGIAANYFVGCGDYSNAVTIAGTSLTSNQKSAVSAACWVSKVGPLAFLIAAGCFVIVASIFSLFTSMAITLKVSWYYRTTWICAVSVALTVTSIVVILMQVTPSMIFLYDCSSLSTAEAAKLMSSSNMICAFHNPATGQNYLNSAIYFVYAVIYFLSGAVAAIIISIFQWIFNYNHAKSVLYRQSLNESAQRQIADKEKEDSRNYEMQRIRPDIEA